MLRCATSRYALVPRLDTNRMRAGQHERVTVLGGTPQSPAVTAPLRGEPRELPAFLRGELGRRFLSLENKMLKKFFK